VLDLPPGEVHVWVGADLTAAVVLAGYLDEPPDALSFDRRPDGKPFLVHPSAPCFNLSHSGALVAVAVARREVGVDIEQLRPVAHRDGVAERIMNPDELARYQALDDVARSDFLLWVWARKEALVKATGEGIRRSLQEVACEPRADDRWQVADFDVPGFAAAVAADGDDWSIHRL
jgi:4'-phosphopantetheinyl transferase